MKSAEIVQLLSELPHVKVTASPGHITVGVPGSIPSCCRMGISVFPNLSNAACDVQTSNTIRLSFGPNAVWYERPDGLPAPAFFNSLMHSSYFAADIPLLEK